MGHRDSRSVSSNFLEGYEIIMARTRIYANNSSRQRAYTQRRRLLRISLPATIVDTLTRISTQIWCERTELLAAMIQFAMDKDLTSTDFDTRFDARTMGPTRRLDIPLPEGVDLTREQVVVMLQWALRNRQWSRFGLRD